MIERVEFRSAADFIAYLRPSHERWWNAATGRRTHLFRGQAQASWPLLPKGWRPLEGNLPIASIMHRLEKHWDLPPIMAGQRPLYDIGWLWRMALAEAAIQFAILGREVGLEIPWQVEPSLFDRAPDHVPYIDPSLLALAQHHGIPTQLLDWSFDPLTAGYFAATGSAESEDLCVWALKISKIEHGDENVPILTIAPNSGNANLKAQSGCFLAYPQGPRLEYLFESHGNKWPEFDKTSHLESALTKIILSGDERRQLTELLLREGRSQAHLMPSWDNVFSTLMESWRR